jgi:hypothetical protein
MEAAIAKEAKEQGEQMIAVDTNVLVRLLTKDDRDQAKHAAKLFGENGIFIPNRISRIFNRRRRKSLS